MQTLIYLQDEIKVMSDDQLSLAEKLFAALGLRRNSVRILAHLGNNREVTADELEVLMNISQPSVSTAIKELIERGWVETSFIRSEGKGRPRHQYSLSKPYEKVVDDIELETRDLINQLERGVRFFREV